MKKRSLLFLTLLILTSCGGGASTFSSTSLNPPTTSVDGSISSILPPSSSTVGISTEHVTHEAFYNAINGTTLVIKGLVYRDEKISGDNNIRNYYLLDALGFGYYVRSSIPLVKDKVYKILGTKSIEKTDNISSLLAQEIQLVDEEITPIIHDLNENFYDTEKFAFMQGALVTISNLTVGVAPEIKTDKPIVLNAHTSAGLPIMIFFDYYKMGGPTGEFNETKAVLQQLKSMQVIKINKATIEMKFKLPELVVTSIDDFEFEPLSDNQHLEFSLDKLRIPFAIRYGDNGLYLPNTYGNLGLGSLVDYSYLIDKAELFELTPALNSSSAKLLADVTEPTLINLTVTARKNGLEKTKVIAVKCMPKSLLLASELFISEFYEGINSSSHAMEIFNGTGEDVDLHDYSLEMFLNGNRFNKSVQTFPEGTILKNNECAVIYGSAKIDVSEFETKIRSLKAAGILTISSDLLNITGNDPIRLYKGQTLLETLGELDINDEFFHNDTYLKDFNVLDPTPTFSAGEWLYNDQGTYLNDLGIHHIEITA